MRRGERSSVEHEATNTLHVVRTLRALELMSRGPVSRAELAEALDVHPRTAARLASRLVDEGYAQPAKESAPGTWTATMKVVALAGQVLDRTDLIRVAFAYVARLRNAVQEAAHLSIPGDVTVMHVIQETAQSVVMVKARVGETVPYHSTAVGKAVLAYSPATWDRLHANPFERFTKNTICDPADLLVELGHVRSRGYAIDDCENDLALRCVAAPVFDHTGTAVASLGVSVPVSRIPYERVELLGAEVVSVAAALSSSLGFVTRTPAETASGEVART